jgi:hypothetical protein
MEGKPGVRHAILAGTFAGLIVTAVPQASAALQAAAPPPQTSVDVSRLPIDIEKIHRELRESSEREERDGLNLRYVIDVYGQAPPLVLFESGEELVYGPVPWSAPTHRDMIEHVTPKEYRAPAADFSALLRWLAERAQK